VKLYGVRTPVVTKLADRYFGQLEGSDKTFVFALCNELFCSGYLEESFIASRWSYKMHDHMEREDFRLFDHWVQACISNWAACDTFCNHTVGAFMEKFPECVWRLSSWACSDSRWVRRAAAVSLIIPAKRGKFLDEAFVIAGLLLTDPEDLVQKGYGWLLKEESRVHRDAVFSFVMKHKDRMPRTALRYAIELMPPEMKKTAMAR
jgi:3-methyladenine DNA glycosylase AlkD